MGSSTVGRLLRRPLGWDLEPTQVLGLLRPDAHPVALLGSWAGGGDVLASDPTRVRCPPMPLADVTDGPWPGGVDGPWPGGGAEGDEGAEGDGGAGADPADTGGLPAFGGGWIGYLGFALAEQLLPAPPAPGHPRRLPAWWFGWYDNVLRRDRATGSWTFEALVTPGRADALDRRFQDLVGRAANLDARPRPYTCGTFGLEPSAADHQAAVRRVVELIHRGDVFQANVCLRLEAGFSGDPLDAFSRAADLLDPPYAAFLQLDGGAVASLSPELFLRRTGSRVLTRPIKGTRRRPTDERESARERELLLGSVKDRAENTMIVDLVRNDLSRVCVAGSVVVPRLAEAEAHPGVWHLVSDVAGTLRPGSGDGELVAATFPPGSVTGAPKVRAVEVVHEIETSPREVYTGAIGYRGPLAGLELNVAIRTFEFAAGRVWLGAGGGITVRSDAAEEFRECLLKAAPLVDAIGGEIAPDPVDTAPGPAVPAAGRDPGWRPRPAAGVFTSVAVRDGRIRLLDDHLSRLEGSTRRLFGKSLPASVRDDVRCAVAQHPSGRLRITARPVGGPLQVHVEVVPQGPGPASVDLHPVTVARGLGADKWSDRRLLAALTAGLGPEDQLLLQGTAGEVLETDRASLFVVSHGVLTTPPADGRLLPGVTRAAVLRLARAGGVPVGESSLTLVDLHGADEVFVTSSVHGVTPVRSVGGTPVGSVPGAVTARISALVADIPARAVSDAPLRHPLRPPPGRHRPVPHLRGTASPIVVLVDNHDSFTHNLAHLLMVHGARVEVVRNDEVSAAEIVAAAPDGIVVSPGPCTPAEAGISVETIATCPDTTPLLGVCLGHQAIGVAFGGRVVRAPRPVHGQADPVTHDGSGVLAGLPQDFAAARYHSLLVEEESLPRSLEITARGPGGLLMGLRHRTRPWVEGVQFHPESILSAHGDAMIRTFVASARARARQAGPVGATSAHAGDVRDPASRETVPQTSG